MLTYIRAVSTQHLFASDLPMVFCILTKLENYFPKQKLFNKKHLLYYQLVLNEFLFLCRFIKSI